MKNLPTWVKVLAGVLVAVVVLAISASLYKAIKGDGGPNNSIFDGLFGSDPPTTDDTGPVDNFFGERADGEYVEYLVHSGKNTSDGLALVYTENQDNGTMLLGFAFEGLEAGKNYCVSWQIDHDKVYNGVKLFVPYTESGDPCIRFSLDFTAEKNNMQRLELTSGNASDILNNCYYFKASEDTRTCFFGFIEGKFAEDGSDQFNEYVSMLKNGVNFTVSVVE